MLRNEFYKAVAAETGMTIKDTKVVFESAEKVIVDDLKAGNDVHVFDGVTFTKKYKEAGVARNPRTGESVAVPAKYVPKVKFGKKFKDGVQ